MKIQGINGRKSVIFLSLFFVNSVFANGDSVSAETPSHAIPLKRQFSGAVELGGLYQTKDAIKLGDYTGLDKKGGYVIANVELTKRDPHDASTARYLRLEGFNLGLTSREAYAEYGNQGNYKAFVGFDQLPKFQTQNAKTVFSGDGSTELTLPTDWVSAPTTTGMTTLNESLRNLDVDHERRKYLLGFSKIFPAGWMVDAQYQREVKEGTKITGGVIGNSGGNPRAALIPEPIDYITHQLTARAGYATSRFQVQASYLLSLFDDRNTSFAWRNPFSAISGWASAAGYAAGGKGQIATPPDNRFHQFQLGGGYNLGEHTRFTANLAKGRMTQNEGFLPFSVNQALTVTTPLPRTSLDGRIDTTVVTLNLTSRPISKLQWGAQYRFDDRKNRTPQAQYNYIGGDSQIQDTASTSNKKRTNLPYSFRQNQFKVDAGYHLPASLQLKGSYTFDAIHRTFSELKQTRENTGRLELRRNEIDMLGAGLFGVVAKRNGSFYDATAPFYASYSSGYIDSLSPSLRFGNHPELRKFSFANRLRRQAGLWGSFTPREVLSFQIDTKFNRDDYRRSELGLKKSNGSQTTFDATYTPKKWLVSHAFYTYEFLRLHLNGRSHSQTNYLDLAQNWSTTLRDRTHTVGVGIELTELKDRFDVGLQYLFSQSRGNTSVMIGSSLTPPTTPIPVLVTRLHNVELYGKYKLAKNLKVKMSYLYERLKTKDWAWDNVLANTMANVISTGEESPHHSVSVFGLSLSYDI